MCGLGNAHRDEGGTAAAITERVGGAVKTGYQITTELVQGKTVVVCQEDLDNYRKVSTSKDN